MKTIIICLLLFINISAQNVWYIDRDVVGGNHDGTSWANAWRHFDYCLMIFRGNGPSDLSGGDTVYVSGGTDSTIHYLGML